MKSYFIGLLVITVLFLSSIIYKHQNTATDDCFPVPKTLKQHSEDVVPLYLFLYFSEKDCASCLVKIAEVLNSLPSQYRSAGIIQYENYKDEIRIRGMIGADFPLYKKKEFKMYIPWSTPTIVGVSPAGKIVFVLPGTVPGTYLKKIVGSVYGDHYDMLKKEYMMFINRGTK